MVSRFLGGGLITAGMLLLPPARGDAVVLCGSLFFGLAYRLQPDLQAKGGTPT